MTDRSRLDLVRHMQYFVALADEGHFGRAADRLGMSQPPLSQGLRRLERSLGRSLVVRGTPLRLTAAGQDLLPLARVLIADAAQILGAGRPATATVRLGVLAELPLSLVDELIATLARADRSVVVTTAGTQELIAATARSGLDVALVEHPCVLRDVCRSAGVARLRRRVVLPTGHPLARRRRIALGDLRGQSVALAPRADNPAGHDLTRDLLAAHGVLVDDVTVTGDRGAALAVAGGRSLALSAARRIDGTGCRLVALTDDPLPLRLRVITSPAAEHLMPDVSATALRFARAGR